MSKNKQILEPNTFCCENFKENASDYGWFSINIDNVKVFLMPHIKGTNLRINFCPSCGKNCRETTIDANLIIQK